MTKHRGHERNSLHRGDLPATLVELADAIAPYPAGTSVEDVLRALWDEVTFWETNTRQFGGLRVDSILFKTQQRSFTMDAYYKWRDFMADAVVQATMTGSTAMDAWVGGPRHYGSFDLDSVLFSQTSGSLTADAVKRAILASSFTMDSRYVYSTLASFVTDAVLFGTVGQSFPVNAVTKKTYDGTFLLDSLLSQTFGGTLDLDSIVQRTMAATLLLDAVIDLGLVTVNGDFTLDAALSILRSDSATADAVIRKVIASAFTLDGVVKGLTSATFSLDALIGLYFTIYSKIRKNVIYRPTSDVSKSSTTYSTGTTAWSLVDESTLDTSDWFENVTVNGWTMLGITPGSHPSSDIKSVTIEWRGRNSAPAFAFLMGVRNGTTNYDSNTYGGVSIAQNATTGSWTMTARPWGGSWTTTDIDNLAFGVIAPSSLAKGRTYQTWVSVAYY